jgi:hypothetical protein
MATLRLTMKLDNSAFEAEPGTEAARILREVAEQVERQLVPDEHLYRLLFDANGNSIGAVKVTDETISMDEATR